MPPIAPPQGYMDLAAVQSLPRQSIVSVIGVVVDCLSPMQTSGTDSVITFKLQDPRLRDATYSGEGLKVRYFSSTAEGLPSIKAKGDIALLRNVRVADFNNERLLISTRTGSRQLVFSESSVPAPALKLGYVTGNSKLRCHGSHDQKLLSIPEQDYIITMKSEMDIPVQPFDFVPAQALAAPNGAGQPGTGNVAAPTGPAGAYSAKFKLVKDLRHYTFSDVCVEVVKKFTNNYGNCELYVTDYTANKQMFYYAPPEEEPSDLVRDGDRFGYSGPSKQKWPGPYGFLVLKVNLCEPHASYADQHIAQGDMIALENVKMKLMPDSSRLEGDMWPDQNNQDKVQIRKLRPARKEIMELCLRKDEYWASRHSEEQGAQEQVAGAEAGLTKAQKKRLRRKEREEEERQKAEKIAEKKAVVAER
jgi:protection-of-telomeres protein 1